ncbi:hypothetical protein [Actinoplanes couchii]|uniref:Uncharacterized protein n=1 Tax=Actinoplanes couchii TaxID=403638 RepID=A0ABQ3XH25_9ACTN|nr:hypothetical protein [Actinoplanes couchii]MDR6320721.1 hypothetical protein [Actinoplanes couchii]GID57794.1 hypothetical protein Aco03nite_061980 [Actinoplanes couchii]
MGYEWLTEALARLRDIESQEVTQVLSAERRLPLAAESAGVHFLTISGRTGTGRPLVVAVRLLGGHRQQIIGAREMTPEELVRFKTWEADAS